jgi:hypothetical protein
MKLKTGSWKVSVVSDAGSRKSVTMHDGYGRNHRTFYIPSCVEISVGDRVSIPLRPEE